MCAIESKLQFGISLQDIITITKTTVLYSSLEHKFRQRLGSTILYCGRKQKPPSENDWHLAESD